MIEEGEIFNSHDVVSLFTNTPINQSLEVIGTRLKNDSTLGKRTLLNVEDIIELLKFVLTTTYFSFRGIIYKQLFGAAMGSPVSPVVANLYMEFLEQQAITTAPIDCKPRLWKRYVDDILEIVRKDQVDNLTTHLNQTDPTDKKNMKVLYHFLIPSLCVNRTVRLSYWSIEKPPIQINIWTLRLTTPSTTN